jgi:hypothetical protein
MTQTKQPLAIPKRLMANLPLDGWGAVDAAYIDAHGTITDSSLLFDRQSARAVIDRQIVADVLSSLHPKLIQRNYPPPALIYPAETAPRMVL